MIRKISYLEIDFHKYDVCINSSAQYKYSAKSHFLDVCAGKNQWEILIYGDYEAVMPIPFIKKMGYKMVVNPKLCQQLGIFSIVDQPNLNQKFLDYFRKNYRVWFYAFNEYNHWEKPLLQRKNYIIPQEDYANVFKKYSPKRKRKLRLDDEVKENSTIEKVGDWQLIEAFILQNSIGADSSKDLKDFLTIYFKFLQQNQLHFYGFFYREELINLLAIYEDPKSVALLGTFNKKETIKLNGSSVLVDYAISQFVQEKDFDFEGSEVPSIEEFFRGYRPVERPYPYYENLSESYFIRWGNRIKSLFKNKK